MAESKKAASKRIIDVQHADKAPAQDNSKPVIVTNRPILQDPMVVDKTTEEEPVAKTTGGTTIQPLTAPEVPGTKSKSKTEEPAEASGKPEQNQEAEQAQTEEPAPQVDETKTLAELDAEAKNKVSKPEPAPQENEPAESEDDKKADDAADSSVGQKTDDQVTQDEELEAAEQARKDEELQKLAESKKYFLPINTVEKRRCKQVVIAGVVLSLILIVAWLDIALDAGLIQLGGVKAVTNFF